MNKQHFPTTPADFPDKDMMLSMSGLEFMQGVLEGRMFAPPIANTLDFTLHTVSDGSVTFHGTPNFDHCNPMGTIHGGWYGTLLDSCMACAIMTKVPKGSVYTTLEYRVNIIRSIPLGTPIKAVGTVDHSGRSTGVARGEIRDIKTDKLYATGSTTCMIMQLAP